MQAKHAILMHEVRHLKLFILHPGRKKQGLKYKERFSSTVRECALSNCGAVVCLGFVMYVYIKNWDLSQNY